MDDVPQWAKARAIACIQAEPFGASFSMKDCGRATIRAFARYIQRHEDPPVDDIAEALRATFGAAAPEFVAAFKAELSRRGLELAKRDGE